MLVIKIRKSTSSSAKKLFFNIMRWMKPLIESDFHSFFNNALLKALLITSHIIFIITNPIIETGNFDQGIS